jgi:hypothetical protein
MEGVYLLALAQEGASVGYDLYSCETSVGNTMKDFVVILSDMDLSHD